MTDETQKNTAYNSETDHTVENRLVALYRLQQIDSGIDRIATTRGELPLEVQDLEDEVSGLEIRLKKYAGEEEEFTNLITDKKNAIADSKKLILKYKEQEKNVRNNREFESIANEIEFQDLEIQLAEKRIREYNATLQKLRVNIEQTKEKHENVAKELEVKKGELDSIIKATEEAEHKLQEESLKCQESIEPRYLSAYKRIRGGAKNGLAVVPLDRDACGGCFSKTPFQRQMEVHMHKKIIICEYCGRILVDDAIVDMVNGKEEE